MSQHDADLVRRWQRGETAAFEALVQRWQQPIARFLGRLAGRRDLVQDLCQEVFLRLYLAGPRYREAGAFSPWLYRIALNVARDAARRRRPDSQPLNGQEPAREDHHAEDACARQELAEAMARAVAELPQPLREVLVLRHYEDMNFEQMGRLLGVPPSTLKSRFAVALQRLRDRLRQLGWSNEENEP
jgi:RNA polymerase sigma-70 factor (ECF subfamily)